MLLKPICYGDVADSAQSLTLAGTKFPADREHALASAHAFAVNALRPEIRLISVADLVRTVEGVSAGLGSPAPAARRRLLRAALLPPTPLSPAGSRRWRAVETALASAAAVARRCSGRAR
jgi:hypothetical protein